MKIRMLETVEDTNPEIIVEDGQDRVVHRTDPLRLDQIHDIGDRQASRLLAPGMAEEAAS